MDGSDDYPIDDIVFDDQTLAVLDQAEQKYQTSLTQSHSAPTNKRQKTNDGWRPGIGANADIDDDLPEISLKGDGSYGIGKRTVPSNNVSIPGFAPRKPTIQPNIVSNTRPHVVNHSPATHIQRTDVYPSGSRSPSRQISHTTLVPQKQQLHNGNQPQSGNSDTKSAYELRTQLSELQKKMDELREENTRMQAALKEATNSKLAKEGEVSVLRKTIEKTAQSHASQLQQLKSDKEKAELKQAQIQKDMKAELERLRTQNMFKQQEIDAASRKVPISVRAKKIPRDIPSTPLAVPPAMAGWNTDRLSQRASLADETPVRQPRSHRENQNLEDSPARKSPTKSKKLPTIPGFDNAFTSTPTRSPSKRDKGKAKAKLPSDQDNSFFGNSISQSFNPLSTRTPGPSQLSSQHVYQDLDMIGDYPGPSVISPRIPIKEPPPTVNGEKDDDVLMEEIEVSEPINWKAELCRIILTHAYDLDGQTSFQRLLGSSQFLDASNNYAKCCSRIMGAIANSTNTDLYEDTLRVTCESFLSIFAILLDSNQEHSLIILMNLLTRLILSLPSLQSVLLASTYALKEGQNIDILDLLCKVILKHLDPSRTPPSQTDIASETLSLLEILSFRIPRELIDKMDIFVRNLDALMLLVHASQPVWFLERSSMILVFLSTHHSIFRSLLGITNNVIGESSVKNSLIERLCSHLTDTSKPPHEEFKLRILSFFAQLSIVHPDAFATLIASPVLIPSLVLYISLLTTPLWEDDPSLVSSSEATSKLIQAVAQATLLLHHFIFGIEPCLNLRLKLFNAPHRPFNGLNHIFVVTLGRMGYCDPPSWIDAQGRKDLEHLYDVARDIIEVVVDGPEGDSIWAAFQESVEDDEMEEDEMEARLLGPES